MSINDERMGINLISQFLQMGVIAEVEKRITNGTITQVPFEIQKIRHIQKQLPDGKVETIVELNEEVRLVIETTAKRKIEAGERVSLEDLTPEDCHIQPPIIDGKPRAYFLCFSLGFDHNVYFDFGPNDPRYEEIEAERKAKGIKGIAFDVLNLVRNTEFNYVVKPIEKLRLLKDHNWPPAPGYFPFTLLQIHNDPATITKPEFVQIVAQSYDSTFWNNRIEFWKSTNLFPNRIQYIERAVKAHFEKDFICSIHVLLPQFEGIIRDYLNLNSVTPTDDSFQGKVKELKNLLLSRKVLMVPKHLLGVLFEFLKSGSFWLNTSKIKDATAEINRHGVLHGIFTGFETEVISLKYLTLLDGLSFLLLYDKAILGKL